MRTIRVTLMLLALNLTGSAQEYIAKSASGTTNAVVSWPGTKLPLQLTAVDATSDKAASVLTWRVGQAGATVAIAAGATATNATCYANVLASNDVVLLQNTAGLVTQATVWGKSSTTHRRAEFDQVLDTSYAVGDTLARLHPDGYPLIAPCEAGATFFADRITGLGEGSNIVMQTVGTLWLATVDSATDVYSYSIPLIEAAPGALSYANAVYLGTETGTNLVTAAVATATNLNVAGTNKFEDSCYVIIEAASGNRAVRQVTTVTTTNLLITPAVGFALSANDWVTKLTNATTVEMPSVVGSTTIGLAASNGIAAGTLIVAVPSTGSPWKAKASAAATRMTAHEIVTVGNSTVYYAAGTKFFLLTNSTTLSEPPGPDGFQATLASVSGFSAGDQVALLGAENAAYLYTYRNSAERVLDTVSFTGALGIAMGRGNVIYKSGSVSAPVGATSVHWFGPAVFVAPAGMPATLSVDGTSACKINNAVGFQ